MTIGATMAVPAFSPHEAEIRDAVVRLCAPFDDAYWLAKDRDGGFPEDFHRAFAEAGWLGICIPQEHGGSGLGVTEAAVMMQAVAESGAGLSGASALHMNIFGLNPVVKFGTDRLKDTFLPRAAAGDPAPEFPDEDIARLKHEISRPDQFTINFDYLVRRLERRG